MTLGLHADDSSGAGHIEVSPRMEQGVSSKNKVPRVTMSHWRFAEGGVGSLTHTVALRVNSLCHSITCLSASLIW